MTKIIGRSHPGVEPWVHGSTGGASGGLAGASTNGCQNNPQKTNKDPPVARPATADLFTSMRLFDPGPSRSLIKSAPQNIWIGAHAQSTPELLDMVWTSNNHHDLYAFFGSDQAAQFDAAVFRMLKPGGSFIVIDHAANPDAAPSTIKRLHRIDPAIVKSQAIAAGFVLEAESAILRNPYDPHDQPVFAPSIRGHTDQFVLKFRKPQ